MNLFANVLGTTAVRKLEASRSAHVLVIGKDRFTRQQLAGVECFNFHACRLLTNVFNELKVPHLQYVYDKLSPQALAMPRLGVVSLAVLGAAFEARQIGDLQTYAQKHAVKKNGDYQIATFDTLKRREHEREQTAKKRTPKPRS